MLVAEHRRRSQWKKDRRAKPARRSSRLRYPKTAAQRLHQSRSAHQNQNPQNGQLMARFDWGSGAICFGASPVAAVFGSAPGGATPPEHRIHFKPSFQAGPLKQDISTLLGIGHFYFALTRGRASERLRHSELAIYPMARKGLSPTGEVGGGQRQRHCEHDLRAGAVPRSPERSALGGSQSGAPFVGRGGARWRGEGQWVDSDYRPRGGQPAGGAKSIRRRVDECGIPVSWTPNIILGNTRSREETLPYGRGSDGAARIKSARITQGESMVGRGKRSVYGRGSDGRLRRWRMGEKVSRKVESR